MFGNRDPSNFTADAAVRRSRILAERWAASAISGASKSAHGPQLPPEPTIDVTTLRRRVTDLAELIENQDITEGQIERFFDENDWMLLRSMGYSAYKSQIEIPPRALADSDQGIKPDKFLERTDGLYDVLDLKKPNAKLVAGPKNRKHASNPLSEAAAQVRTYITFCSQPAVRDNLAAQGITVLSPLGIVLMGRRPDLKDWEAVKPTLGIKAFTYDDIIGSLETIIDWVEKTKVDNPLESEN